VSLGLLVEPENLGRAGWVRAKNWTLPSSGRRWKAPPPRQFCTVRRSCRRLGRRPALGARQVQERAAAQPQWRARERLPYGGATAKARERAKTAATPHKGKRGGSGARAPTRKHTACRRVRVRAPTVSASATDRQGRRRRQKWRGSGRGERVVPEEASRPPPREARPSHSDGSPPAPRVVARAADVATDRN